MNEQVRSSGTTWRSDGRGGTEQIDERAMDDVGREFAVVRPFPTLTPRDGELVVPPLEYASIASRPEPVRVI